MTSRISHSIRFKVKDQKTTSSSAQASLPANSIPSPVFILEFETAITTSESSRETTNRLVPTRPPSQNGVTSGHQSKDDSSPEPPRSTWQPLSPEDLKKLKDRRKKAKAAVISSDECKVPLCLRSNCSLPTHQRYAGDTKSNAPSADEILHRISPDSNPFDNEQIPGNFVIRDISSYPQMPSKSLDNDVFRELLHDFCVELFDHLNALIHPPRTLASAKEQFRKEKDLMFAVAMSNPVYCLNFIATTYHYRVLRKRDDLARHSIRDPVAAKINGQLLRLLREKLTTFKLANADQLILVVLTLVMFDIGQGNYASLDFHRRAMVALVESCGGVHNMGRSIPYATALDRIISIHTGYKPMFSALSDELLSIQRAPRYPTVYGSFFNSDLKQRQCDLDADIVSYCEGACRAIEILEGEDLNFDPAQTRDSSEVNYFFFLRERLTGQFAHLNARHFQSYSKSYCVLLAAKIVDYETLMNNYMPSITMFLADRLKDIICQQGVEDWAGWKDVLNWILFVLLSMSTSWEGRKWALSLMTELLNNHYGKDQWPWDWHEQEQEKILKFVWAKTRFEHGFNECCTELEPWDTCMSWQDPDKKESVKNDSVDNTESAVG